MHRKPSRFGCLGGLGGPRRPFQTKEGLARHLADEGANLPGPNVALRAGSSLGSLKIGSPAVRRPDGVDAPELVPFLRPADGRTKWIHWSSSRCGRLGCLGVPRRPLQTKEGLAPHLASGGANFRGPRLPCNWIFAGGKLKIGSPAGRRPGGEHPPEVVPFWVFGRPGLNSQSARCMGPHSASAS